MINSIASVPSPFTKSKIFQPAPVKKWGVPSYADGSVRGSNVWGTAAWQSWWEEQFYYCIHGYNTGGVWIPPRFYFYLNFNHLSTPLRGVHLPDYIDVQLEFHYLVEQAKLEMSGIVMPKTRRKGVSEMMAAIINHGIRFIDKYQSGVATSSPEYLVDFCRKIDLADSLYPPEISMHRLVDNKDDIEYGWREKDIHDKMADAGSRAHIYKRVMAMNANLFKGTMMNDAIFEEAFEFKLIRAAVDATVASLKVGKDMVGTPYVYGTGNRKGPGTKEVQEIYQNAFNMKFLTFFIPGKKMYFPFVADSINPSTLKPNEIIPNLQEFQPHERVGMSDEIAAQAEIERMLAQLKKKSDKTEYLNFLQENTDKINEIFMRMGSNNFPSAELNEQGFLIDSVARQYKHYRPEDITENGKPLSPRQIRMVPLTDDEMLDEEKVAESVMILHEGHPINGWKNLEVAGIDSYDLDQSKTSKSLGSMVVLRKFHILDTVEKMLPVALIRCRPRKKEFFYELCVKVSIYYNLIGNTLIDVAKGQIIQYYKDCGQQSMLARRPRKFESEDSKQSHDFGVALTGFSKPRMIGLLQTFFLEHYKKVWFPDMIKEALDYDEKEDDSDNDSIDALGIALMQMISEGLEAYNENDENLEDPYALVNWLPDSMGNMIADGGADIDVSDVKDPFIRYVMTGRFH